MASLAFARTLGGEVCLDLCWTCQAIWFDAYESVQLAPAGVVALFRAIHENRVATQPVAEVMRCPRCTRRLAIGQDMTKSGHFVYYRCTSAHGRFTPFNQFLIEKGFIRALTNVEITQLKTEIKIICCSSCGAPVDLQHDAVCSHCRAPIAILDVQAVEKALAAYTEAGAAKAMREHDVVAEMVLQQERFREEQLKAGRAERMDGIDLIGSSLLTILALLN
jgi:hypothetical protein